jgi:hypothetical protein
MIFIFKICRTTPFISLITLGSSLSILYVLLFGISKLYRIDHTNNSCAYHWHFPVQLFVSELWPFTGLICISNTCTYYTGFPVEWFFWLSYGHRLKNPFYLVNDLLQHAIGYHEVIHVIPDRSCYTFVMLHSIIMIAKDFDYKKYSNNTLWSSLLYIVIFLYTLWHVRLFYKTWWYKK